MTSSTLQSRLLTHTWPFACALLAMVPDFAGGVEPHSVEFTVSETAGIRRRSDVVTAHLDLPHWQATETKIGFRLIALEDREQKKIANPNPAKANPANAKPVKAKPARLQTIPVQVHPIVSGDSAKVIVDFIADFQPLETRRYRLEYGPTVESRPISGGLTLTELPQEFRVDSGNVVHWALPRDLRGLLRIAWKEVPYVLADSPGLYSIDKNGTETRLHDSIASSAVVSRRGPIATALRWTYPDTTGDKGSGNKGSGGRVEMEFYRTKSWVHVTWEVDDASAQIEQLAMGLNLDLDGKETLIDYGGADFVYTTVRAGQSSLLEAGPTVDGNVPWKVLHGAQDDMQPLVVSPQQASSRVFGWVHAMDSKRCTALAVRDFATSTRDQIRIDGDGHLKLAREFPDRSSGKKQLEFWMHFVTMPVHIGARTSPRSMQEPLQVRQLD